MKKLIFFTYALAASMGLIAQDNYLFSQRTETYTQINNGTVVSTPDWDDFTVGMKMPFLFKYYNVSVDSIYITDDGAYFFYEKEDYLSPNGSDPISRGGGQSPVSYRVDGSVNSRILKVQWSNISFYDIVDAFPNDFANYQVWLYEGSNVIEFHNGSSSFSRGAYDIIGIFPFMNDMDNVKGIVLDGDPAFPTANYDLNNAYGLIENPAVNTVYVFTPGILNGVNRVSASKKVNLYPNPAPAYLTIETETDIRRISILNTSGQTLYKEAVHGQLHYVSTSWLSSGVYMIQLETDTGIITEKFVK